MTASSGYVLAGNLTELDRLRLQSRVWQPAAERFLEAIPVRLGWRCADLGCGPVGIVAELARRVGPSGSVVGTDIDSESLTALREHVSDLSNISVAHDDAYASQLPAGAFDLVHVRYVFSPVGGNERLLNSMISLARPGAIIAAQETDTSSWKCVPHSNEWATLLALIRQAFLARGGNFDAGQGLYSAFRSAGLQNVHARAELLCPEAGDPYRRIPLLFVAAMRDFILSRGLITVAELDTLTAACERVAADPSRLHMTFTTVQVWGQRPA